MRRLPPIWSFVVALAALMLLWTLIFWLGDHHPAVLAVVGGLAVFLIGGAVILVTFVRHLLDKLLEAIFG